MVDLRNERGAITGAEGCMFFAMFLFAVLLVGLLVVAFFRFSEPPQNLPVGGPPPVGLQAPAREAVSPGFAVLLATPEAAGAATGDRRITTARDA